MGRPTKQELCGNRSVQETDSRCCQDLTRELTPSPPLTSSPPTWWARPAVPPSLPALLCPTGTAQLPAEPPPVSAQPLQGGSRNHSKTVGSHAWETACLSPGRHPAGHPRGLDPNLRTCNGDGVMGTLDTPRTGRGDL